MENSDFYRDFYCLCEGSLEVYKLTVADYQKEVNELKQGLIDYKDSPILVQVYRKNLRAARKRLNNYKQRMVCLEDLFRKHGSRELSKCS